MNEKIRTHHQINRELCGHPVLLEEGRCIVEFTPAPNMAADDTGLVHGGFVFGMADYAAMLAVNHPYVVLGGAEVRFLKPVRTGDQLRAEARREKKTGKKEIVTVIVYKEEETVFKGEFVCFSPDKHVLRP